MYYLSMLSVILDPLLGPSWLFNIGLYLFINKASTDNKVLYNLQNLITLKQS